MPVLAQASLPTAAWAEVPFDIMREVVGRLAPHDVQTTLLVCREWRDGFTNGVIALRPRMLRPRQLSERCATAWLGAFRVLRGRSNQLCMPELPARAAPAAARAERCVA